MRCSCLHDSIMIVIVPDLPPKINGLGDYAWLQAKTLREKYGIGTTFIVAGRNYTDDSFDGFAVLSVGNSSTKLKNALKTLSLKDDTIHLHYVGYGYQKRGIPYWLLTALKPFNSYTNSHRYSKSKIIITFHELYAGSNKPWQSAFWFRQIQKNICKELFWLCDEAITTGNYYASLLKQFADKPVHIMPVFSNVEETEPSLPLAQREKSMVIFSANNINFSFQHYEQALNNFCNQHNINKIILAGNTANIQTSLPVTIEHHLSPQAHEVALMMRHAFACFIGFPSPQWFFKSSVFAAACAHGCLPVAIGNLNNHEGLTAGVHFYDCRRDETQQNPPQSIADAAHQWYMQHSLEKNVELLKRISH